METAAIVCDAAGKTRVRAIIQQLYANNSKTRDGLLKKFDEGLALIARGKQVEGFKKFTDIMKKVAADYGDDKLSVLPPLATELVEELFVRLFVCGGYAAPPDIPLEGDVIVGVVDDPTKSHTFVSTDGDYAVQTDPGMFSQPVVILGEKQPDSFLVQNLYPEHPIKTEITVDPPGMEVAGKQSIIKVCQYEESFDHTENRGFMRIVRRHDSETGQQVTVLPFTTGGPFLECPDEAPTVIGSVGFLSRTLAAAGRALRGVGTFAVNTFAPRELHAFAALVDGGVGGFVEDFGSFYAGATIPDLSVQSITVSPAPRTSVDQIRFDIVVRNDGLQSVPASTLLLQATPTLSTQIAVNNLPGAALVEGVVVPATVTVSYTAAAGAIAAGGHTATATADFNNTVIELDETDAARTSNNSLSQAYTVVPPPDLIVLNDINMFDASGITNAGNVTLVQNIVTYSNTGPRASQTAVLFDVGRGAVLCTEAAPVDYCPSATGPGSEQFVTLRSTVAAIGSGLTIQDVSSSPSNTVLTSIASNVRAIFLWMPVQSFTVAEINALKAFAGEGGRIVFVAENEAAYGPGAISPYVNGLPAMNTFLTGMGSAMQNLGGTFNSGLIPSTSFTNHPIMSGISSLIVDAASQVTVGANDAALFRDATNTNILGAVARIPLAPLSPEPILFASSSRAATSFGSSVRPSASGGLTTTGFDPMTGRQLP